MSLTKTELGARAELAARRWLEREPGARVIRSNYRIRAGEIDLILEEQVEQGDVELVFVEIRSRAPEGWVDGISSVTFSKWRKLERTARHFLAQYRGPATSVRFDVVAWDGRAWLRLKDARWS